LLILGSSILLYRTLVMISGGYLAINYWWVSTLLIGEFLSDLACLASSIWWFRINDRSRDKLPLRLGTAAALLHAVRVLIYVLGRTEPFLNFDVRPQYYHLYGETVWFWVYFAAILALLGVTGVILIWRIRIRNRKAAKD
jgi:hypothetical protein